MNKEPSTESELGLSKLLNITDLDRTKLQIIESEGANLERHKARIETPKAPMGCGMDSGYPLPTEGRV